MAVQDRSLADPDRSAVARSSPAQSDRAAAEPQRAAVAPVRRRWHRAVLSRLRTTSRWRRMVWQRRRIIPWRVRTA
ncbi:hypothetical protein GCM10009535_45850 [Streptomyces thermocarboxydovorans]|uniref:Uncharacterized protein n=1 Tax=Streptomyces thermocarboxydovorans TaxID=59298 RepID=A0ABP3SV88_9ACTN